MLSDTEVTEKQTMAISLILTADKIITEILFKDNNALKVSEVAEFLKTRSEVSQNERALEKMMNQRRFDDSDDNNGELWGVIDDNYTYIVRSQFTKICDEGGFNASGSTVMDEAERLYRSVQRLYKTEAC